MSTEHDVVTFDRHRAWIEEPYAIFMELEGDIVGQNITDILGLIDSIGGGEGPVIIVQNLSKAGAFTGGARKVILEDKRTGRVASVICIGASFQMRVFMTMISKTMKLVASDISTTLFAQDDADARRLLASERERMPHRNDKWGRGNK